MLFTCHILSIIGIPFLSLTDGTNQIFLVLPLYSTIQFAFLLPNWKQFFGLKGSKISESITGSFCIRSQEKLYNCNTFWKQKSSVSGLFVMGLPGLPSPCQTQYKQATHARFCFRYWENVKEMVFCYQNCSYLLWEKIVLVIEKNFWITRTIYSNCER